MSEEEKQAIDTLQNCIADYVIGDYCVGKYCPNEDVCKNDDCPFEKAIDRVVNLVKKQQEEIEELKSFINLGNLEEMYILLNAKTSECEDIRNERDRALKVIDKMADKMKQHLPFTLEMPYGASKEELIDYFYKEIE